MKYTAITALAAVAAFALTAPALAGHLKDGRKLNARTSRRQPALVHRRLSQDAAGAATDPGLIAQRAEPIRTARVDSG